MTSTTLLRTVTSSLGDHSVTNLLTHRESRFDIMAEVNASPDTRFARLIRQVHRFGSIYGEIVRFVAKYTSVRYQVATKT